MKFESLIVKLKFESLKVCKVFDLRNRKKMGLRREFGQNNCFQQLISKKNVNNLKTSKNGILQVSKVDLKNKNFQFLYEQKLRLHLL